MEWLGERFHGLDHSKRRFGVSVAVKGPFGFQSQHVLTASIISLANGFAYWQYQEISNATKTYFDDMAQALSHVQEVSGSLDKVKFMNGGEYLQPSR